MDAGQLIASARHDLGLTQAELADVVGTSRERISTYERGDVDPRTATLQRVLDALQIELVPTPALTYEERRSLAVSAEVARKLVEQPDEVLAHARRNLERMRSIGRHEQVWVRLWESALDLGPRYVAALLTSVDPFARDLRQSSPFGGVLDADERRRALQDVRR
jgi:transcriptional regulator with XRE-family HTH domain